MTARGLRKFLAAWIPVEAQTAHGAQEQRERVQAVAEILAVQGVPGAFVEIGCLHGSLTVMLAEVARLVGRRVIAVDPWEVGTQNCGGGEYEIFCRTIAPYANVIDVLRMRSDDLRAVEFIKARPLALAFVDGLHEYGACLADMQTVSHAAVIAVDDTNWNAEVRQAFEDEAGEREKICIPEFRESWLV